MLGDELIERLAEPLHRQWILSLKLQHGLDRHPEPRYAAARHQRRIHAVVNGADGGKQRLESPALRREQAAEFADIGLPISGHVDDEIAEAIAVFDAPPLDPVRDVQSLEDRGHRTTDPHAGEIVRPRIEAIGQRHAVVMQFALKGLTEAAWLIMLFGDDHLQPGVRQQRGGGETADPRADHGDVEIAAAFRAAGAGQ